MNVKQFVSKWKAVDLKEIAGAQSHFIDICTLVGHLSPTDADPKGEFFTFEITAEKPNGEQGRADAWYKGKFIWEYKRPGSNLKKAYDQLLLYRESLGNPPLLITTDTHDIIIHTNFTNTTKKVYRIDFESLLMGDGLSLLKRAFNDPNSFKPDETQEHVTRATADTFVGVANSLQQWAKAGGTTNDPERLAHFLIRLLFSLFAEDMNLLPDNIFTKLVNQYKQGTTTQLNSIIPKRTGLITSKWRGIVCSNPSCSAYNILIPANLFYNDPPDDILNKLEVHVKEGERILSNPTFREALNDTTSNQTHKQEEPNNNR